MVAKLVYGKFSMLLTGDIEEIAENKILEKVDKEKLKSTVLKVAHHRFKNIYYRRIFKSSFS